GTSRVRRRRGSARGSGRGGDQKRNGHRHARGGPTRAGSRLRSAGCRRGGDGGHRGIRGRHTRRRTAHRRGIVPDMTAFSPSDPVPKTNAVHTGSALLTNDVGLHARPSVKLTQLAKRFGAHIEFARATTGP